MSTGSFFDAYTKGMPPGFAEIVASDSDYEQVIVEIYYNEEFLAVVSQDRSKLEVMIHPRRDGSTWNLNLADFALALETAKGKLTGTVSQEA
jgi:hypothetical protein